MVLDKVGIYDGHYLSLAPSVRFSFLNKKNVTLYGSIEVAFCYSFVDEKIPGIFWGDIFFIRPNITAFGASFGSAFFGFIEVGYGYKGIVSAGFGYRFSRWI